MSKSFEVRERVMESTDEEADVTTSPASQTNINEDDMQIQIVTSTPAKPVNKELFPHDSSFVAEEEDSESDSCFSCDDLSGIWHHHTLRSDDSDDPLWTIGSHNESSSDDEINNTFHSLLDDTFHHDEADTVENQLAVRKEENKKYGQNEANLCFGK